MLFKKPIQPFSSVEEASDFISRQGLQEFLEIMAKYQNSLFNLNIKMAVLYFFIYFGLSSLIFLFDYNKINKTIFEFAKNIGIPIKDPYGWNLSFFLSLLFNIYIFISTIKHGCRWVNKKIICFQNIYLVNYVVITFFSILVAGLMFYLSFYTLNAKSKECTLFSFCWLETENMFYSSIFFIYAMHWVTFIIFFICFFCLHDVKKVELR